MKSIRRLLELLTDYKYLISSKGIKSSWRFILEEIVHLPYRQIEYYVLARPPLLPVPEINSKFADDVRQFSMNDLRYVYQEYMPSEANMCKKRLEKGHHGFVATSNNQTVGYCWLCIDDDLERVEVDFHSGDLMITDSFTSPKYRNRGVQTKLAIAALRYAKQLKFRRLVMYIEVNNVPSLAVWRNKMGAEVIGHIGFTRIGFLRKTHSTNC